MIGILGVLALAGAIAYFGSEAGWWGSGKTPATPSKASPATTTPATEARLGDASRGVTPAPSEKPEQRERTPDAAGAGGPVGAPRFGKAFEEALERGAFREAEVALAKLGGAADAERRLAAAMNAAASRIETRFQEIRSSSGAPAARVYVAHQLDAFPDHAAARGKLMALIEAPESAPAWNGPVPVPNRGDSRPETRAADQPETVAPVDADLAQTRDEAARVLETGDVRAALSVLREVSTAAEARNQQAVFRDAQRLIRQGEAELRLRAAIIDRAGKKAIGDKPVPHLPGERGQVLDATDEGITFAGTQGKVMLKWRVLPLHSLLAIIPLLNLGPAELTDAGATLYRAARAAEADALLAKALQSGGPDVKRAIDQTLADARGMAVPPAGFKLVDDRWLSPQELARHEVAKSIAQSTKDLAAADPAVRKAAFERMVKLGDAAKSPLNRALLLRHAEIREEIAKAPVHAKLAELGARRQEVDEARSHGLELIEDEEKYPYPYRPPEASAETYKQYQIAQSEINIRVAKLRTLWSQPLAVTVPKPLREKIAMLAEVDGFLSALGVAPASPEPGWMMNLPQSDEVTLQTIATSEADRRRIDESAETMHVNATRVSKSTKGELDEAKITNDYRVMFGRAALLVHDQLTTAAHGHCEDMGRLGFFAHQSPVPGKTTPWDRVKLTGMRALGVGENIAEAGGPSSAHNGWCHSSGHHRNLLAAGWRILGVGNSGHYWCQNFSAGEQKPDAPVEDGGEK